MLSLTLAFSDSRKAGAMVTLQGRKWRQPAGRHLGGVRGGAQPGPLRYGGDSLPLVLVQCSGPRDPHLGVPTVIPGAGHWGGGQIQYLTHL